VRGVDTNVLVRLLVDDDAAQAESAQQWLDAALAAGDEVFVPDIVLAELAWVLERAYHLPRQGIATAVGTLLALPGVRVRSAAEVKAALARYPTARAGLADLLLLAQARAAGCDVLATFDRELADEGGATLLG